MLHRTSMRSLTKTLPTQLRKHVRKISQSMKIRIKIEGFITSKFTGIDETGNRFNNANHHQLKTKKSD